MFTSGDATALDIYQSISLLSIPAKVYSMLIGERLKHWIDKQLLEMQCGFGLGGVVLMQFFGLRRLHEEAARRNQAMLICFIELTKAYDSIDRVSAWQVF